MTLLVCLIQNKYDSIQSDEYYTATLNVECPEDALIIASITRDKIVYPQEKTEEVYRKLL